MLFIVVLKEGSDSFFELFVYIDLSHVYESTNE